MRKNDDLNFDQYDLNPPQRTPLFWRVAGFLYKVILLLLMIMAIVLLLCLFYLLASQMFGFENVLFK